MRVVFVKSPAKPRPRAGDTKVINGVLHIRVLKRVYDGGGRPIGYDCTGGRQRYEWQPAPTPPADKGVGDGA